MILLNHYPSFNLFSRNQLIGAMKCLSDFSFSALFVLLSV
jgi:hypothetical protein